MKLLYANKKLMQQCTSLKAAVKLFGGDKHLAESLRSRVTLLQQAPSIKDIILMPPLHFHKLKGERNGYFAIDLKSRRDKWRIILRPMDDSGLPYSPCNIDEIAGVVQIVEIKEVSAHYE